MTIRTGTTHLLNAPAGMAADALRRTDITSFFELSSGNSKAHSMLTESQREELRAFTLHVRRCTVPLMRESDSQAYIEGTGTLFAVNSAHYLITAAHVLEDRIALNQLEQIGIRLGETSNEVSNLGKAHIETFRQIGLFDAAIIRFEQPELIAALQKGWHFLKPTDLSAIRADMSKCLVAGYPIATSRKMGWDFSAQFFCYGSRLLGETPAEARDVREGLDLFLEHRERGEDLDGAVSKVPDLAGVSGASIWGVLQGSDGSAESRLRVIGVETDCRPGSYIRGKNWKLVSLMFRRFDQRAFEEIEDVLNA